MVVDNRRKITFTRVSLLWDSVFCMEYSVFTVICYSCLDS